MTTAELIAKLHELDPVGNEQVVVMLQSPRKKYPFEGNYSVTVDHWASYRGPVLVFHSDPDDGTVIYQRGN